MPGLQFASKMDEVLRPSHVDTGIPKPCRYQEDSVVCLGQRVS